MRQKRAWAAHEIEGAGLAAGPGCALRFAPCMPEPERIVALGFRYWMLGLNGGDIGAWERAWSLYSGMFGAVGAKQAVGCLSRWVSVLGSATSRDIEVFPECCRSFCRDECLAVSLIAACQHDTRTAARACAYALVEASNVDKVVSNARGFAESLLSLDHRLARGSILSAPACIRPASLTVQ